MQYEESVDGVVVSERVNGWWVSVRYGSGREEHHGPYIDEESALSEAALRDPRDVPPEEFRPGWERPDG